MSESRTTYFNDVQRLVDAALLIEAESRVDFGRYTAGDDLEDLAAELNQQVVEGGVDLVVYVFAMLLAILDRLVDKLCVLRLLGRREDQGWVGGRILRLVLINCGKIARVGDHGLCEMLSAMCCTLWHFRGHGRRWKAARCETHGASGFELIKGGRHVD